MSHSPSDSPVPASDSVPEVPSAPASVPTSGSTTVSTPNEAQPSYVKLAMRNMVRKRGQSLFHFALTVIGLLAVLIGLSYLTR